MNQKPYRTLFLWIFWSATALVLYMTLYSDSGVWEFLHNDKSRITWLILGLFLLGFAASFILVLLITLETLIAFRLEEQAQQCGLKSMQLGSSRRAVNRFFAALKTTLDMNSQVDMEALLNVELSAYQRSSHTVEVIGNLLITLGLIGTVMGLTLTLTGLTSSLEALGHNQELLLSGLRQAMAGMGTAFYTTLLGAVLGGVLLRVFAQITDHGVEHLFDRLMRICLVYCTADLQASLERDIRFLDHELEALGHHIGSLHLACNQAREAMSQFRQEVSQLRDESELENSILIDMIRKRQQSSHLLRHEAQLLRALNRPWWIRLKTMLTSDRQHQKNKDDS